MSVNRRIIENLKSRVFAMMPPAERQITFIFPDGHKETFKNGHEALIFAISNPRNEDLRGVTIDPPEADGDSFLLAIMAHADGANEWADELAELEETDETENY